MADPVEHVAQDAETPDDSQPLLSRIFMEIIYSPMNLGLVAVIAYLVYKIIRDRMDVPHFNAKPQEPELPKIRRDFTIQELRQFDGNQPDGRVLVAVNGNVYDVTKGKKFYGPGGPYATFAGRDASRNLATFSVTANDKDEYDDLSDLNAMEMDSVKEWEMQFKEKYDLVGRLLRKGEQPTNYSDEEDDIVADNDDSRPATSDLLSGNDKKSQQQQQANKSNVAAAEGLRKRIGETSSHEDVN